jgi:hypothetical protein
MTTPRRYILNKATRTAHDRTRLKENCNTDQIKARESADLVPQGYRRCSWCK